MEFQAINSVVMALEPTTPRRLLYLGDENGILGRLTGDENRVTKENREKKEVLGPSGSVSRASTRRDEPGIIDVPDPVYDSTRTREQAETGPSAHYHLFYRRTTLPCCRVLVLPTVKQTTQVAKKWVFCHSILPLMCSLP